MAISNTTAVTLSDIAKYPGADGRSMGPIAEVLSKTNEMIQDMPFKMTNGFTGHSFRIRSSKPDVHWTMAGQPTPASKSRVAIVTEDCAMLEGVSEVERKEATMGTNTPAMVRAVQDTSFVEAMGDKFADTLVYGNQAADQREFRGLSDRFNTLTGSTVGTQVISAGGAANLSSMWLIGWGDQQVYGIVPDGMSAGLQMRDAGLVDTKDEFGNHYAFYKTEFTWNVGLAVQDWRYVSRVANINTATLTKDASSGPDLIELAILAKNRIHKLGNVRPAWYVNRAVYDYLELQAAYHPNVRYGKDGAGRDAGYDVLMLCGIPVRRMDAITTSEDAVS